MYKSLRRLPTPVWVLCIGAFINRSGNMVVPYLPLYFIKKLGIGMGTSGKILALFGVGGLVSGPIAGWLSDRYGRIRVMCGSMVLNAGVLLLFPLVTDVFWIVVLVFLLAVVNEAFRPALLASISDHSPTENRKTAFVLLRIFINLGMSFGPAVGGFLAQVSYRYLFFVNAFMTLTAAAYIYWAYRKNLFVRKVMEEEPKSSWSLRDLGIVFKDRSMMYFLFAMIPAMVVFFQHDSTFALYINELLKFPEYAFGLLFTLNTVLILIFEYWINMKSDHFRVSILLFSGAFLSAVGFALFGWVETPFWICVAVSIWTFGEMFLFPAATAYIDSIAPSRLRGTYMGWYGVTISIGWMIAPVLGVGIFEKYGNTILWSFMGVLGLFSAALMAFVKVPKRI